MFQYYDKHIEINDDYKFENVKKITKWSSIDDWLNYKIISNKIHCFDIYVLCV
jgi:hypothetical protein